MLDVVDQCSAIFSHAPDEDICTDQQPTSATCTTNFSHAPDKHICTNPQPTSATCTANFSHVYSQLQPRPRQTYRAFQNKIPSIIINFHRAVHARKEYSRPYQKNSFLLSVGSEQRYMKGIIPFKENQNDSFLLSVRGEPRYMNRFLVIFRKKIVETLKNFLGALRAPKRRYMRERNKCNPFKRIPFYYQPVIRQGT